MPRVVRVLRSVVPAGFLCLVFLIPDYSLALNLPCIQNTDPKSLESSAPKALITDGDDDKRIFHGRGMGIMGPRSEPDAALWSNLAVVLAGFSFMTVIALLQSFVGQNTEDGSQKLRDNDLSVTLSILVSSVLLFLVAADLFSWANGDRVALRASITIMAANYVLALGMLTINFGMIWAFHLFRLRPFAHSAVRWVFVFLLVYSWSFLIPSSGGVLYLIHISEEFQTGNVNHLIGNYWYTDFYFWLSCLPLLAFPSIAHLLAKDNYCREMFSKLNYKPIWAIVSGAFAVILALWVIILAYLIQYTGNSSDPLNIKTIKMWAPPYVTQAFMMIIFSMIEALAVFCLPSENQTQNTE